MLAWVILKKEIYFNFEICFCTIQVMLYSFVSVPYGESSFLLDDVFCSNLGSLSFAC